MVKIYQVNSYTKVIQQQFPVFGEKISGDLAKDLIAKARYKVAYNSGERQYRAHDKVKKAWFSIATGGQNVGRLAEEIAKLDEDAVVII